MANKNLKIQKEKEYNPFSTRTLKRFKLGKVRGYLRAVKQNPKDAFGAKKLQGARYNKKGLGRPLYDEQIEQYDPSTVYYYEVGASDGSYRKCTTIEEARQRFEQLYNFEQRQTEIK